MESCPSGRRCSTRNQTSAVPFRPCGILDFTRVSGGSNSLVFLISCMNFLHFSRKAVIVFLDGELSEWSKVQHSKCCVRKYLGFESLTLRQKLQSIFGCFFVFQSPAIPCKQRGYRHFDFSDNKLIISAFIRRFSSEKVTKKGIKKVVSLQKVFAKCSEAL